MNSRYLMYALNFRVGVKGDSYNAHIYTRKTHFLFASSFQIFALRHGGKPTLILESQVHTLRSDQIRSSILRLTRAVPPMDGLS